MGGATLDATQKDEWVEEVLSAAYYGYTHGHTFGLFSPDNEEDISHNEGITMSSTLYADAIAPAGATGAAGAVRPTPVAVVTPTPVCADRGMPGPRPHRC